MKIRTISDNKIWDFVETGIGTGVTFGTISDGVESRDVIISCNYLNDLNGTILISSEKLKNNKTSSDVKRSPIMAYVGSRWDNFEIYFENKYIFKGYNNV